MNFSIHKYNISISNLSSKMNFYWGQFIYLFLSSNVLIYTWEEGSMVVSGCHVIRTRVEWVCAEAERFKNVTGSWWEGKGARGKGWDEMWVKKRTAEMYLQIRAWVWRGEMLLTTMHRGAWLGQALATFYHNLDLPWEWLLRCSEKIMSISIWSIILFYMYFLVMLFYYYFFIYLQIYSYVITQK